MINLTINGKLITVPAGTTILEAAHINDILIPNLCYLKDVHKFGSCRLCTVEVEGMRNLQPSCVVTAKDGMKVKTNTPAVRHARKVLYELYLSNHPKDCLSCTRNQSCELQEMGYMLGVTESRFSDEPELKPIDVSPSVTRDVNKCILCRRCVTVCNEIQKVGAINNQNRGSETVVSPSMDLPLNNTQCAMCGQCTIVCPTGALSETDGLAPVWKALGDPMKRTVIQVAPAVRASLAEEFGMPPGTLVTGKMCAAMRELGFNDIFDTNFAADLTIIEEGNELLERLGKTLRGHHIPLPMITSCSPGWIKHIEHAYPGQLAHLSSCKSPHTMMGALVKSYYAEKINVKPEDIFMVSVMPCTAKKFEIQRPEMGVDGLADVDAVLTTREFARMIKSAGIDFNTLPDGEFDKPLGFSTGAADIFGVTGGVMEAALRTVYELITGRELPFKALHVTPIIGSAQIKTAELVLENTLPLYKQFEGVAVKVAVTSGLAGADILMDEIAAGKSPYHFIEVMGCPDGCINGGGQPRSKHDDYRALRSKAIYSEDESKVLRKSHENPDVQALYKDYLGECGGQIAHHLLHTHYTPRGRYNEPTETVK